MFAELNGKIATRLKTISLHLDSFNIRFDSFSNKSVVTMSHGVSIKIEGSDLAMQKGFKKNETLRGSAPIVSLFMTNMKRYTGLYVSTNVIQNKVVGVRAPLLWAVPVKLRYGHIKYVTYEQPQFLPLGKLDIQTIEINTTGKLVSFLSETSIVTLVFRRKSLFHWCINYQHLREQLVKEVMVLAVSSNSWQERLYLLLRRVFRIREIMKVCQSWVQVLDDVISRGEDVNVAIKRRSVERSKKMCKKSISRAIASKTPVVSKLSQGADLQ